MKRLLTILTSIIFALAMSAQFNTSSPLGNQSAAPVAVNWKASMKMTSSTVGIITLTADIQQGWHIYGTKAVKSGPIATQFSFDKLNNVVLVGKTKSSKKASSHFDKTFDAKVSWWEGKVVFTQKFKVTNPSAPYSIGGNVKYMSCNEDKQKCNPPKAFEFSFKK